MEFDLEGDHADRAYALLSALVTPRPIAWVTTIDSEGAVNVAPFSLFNVLGVHPPVVGFCPADRTDGTPTLTVRTSWVHTSSWSIWSMIQWPKPCCKPQHRYRQVSTSWSAPV